MTMQRTEASRKVEDVAVERVARAFGAPEPAPEDRAYLYTVLRAVMTPLVKSEEP